MPENESELERLKQITLIKDESDKLVNQLKQPILNYLEQCKTGLVPINTSLSVIVTAVIKFYEAMLLTAAMCDIQGVEPIMQDEVTEAEEIIKLEKDYGDKNA